MRLEKLIYRMPCKQYIEIKCERGVLYSGFRQDFYFNYEHKIRVVNVDAEDGKIRITCTSKAWEGL